jgi:hypothetical protein
MTAGAEPFVSRLCRSISPADPKHRIRRAADRHMRFLRGHQIPIARAA